jgi:hypothetical protein
MPKCGNKNAQKHGAFSSAIILPNEDPAEFEKLRGEVCDEWKPEGLSEIEKVNSIAMNMWRKQRLRRYFKKKLDRAAGIANAFNRKDKRKYESLIKVLEDIEAGLLTEEYLSKTLTPADAQRLKQKHPRDKYSNEKDWRSAITEEIIDALEIYDVASARVETIDDLMSDETFADRELSIEERIDAKIDKDIKQLVQIKTMKTLGIGRPR